MSKIIIYAREKLVEKDIHWQEKYTVKTAFLKRQFQAVIGEGSYFRFEGDAPDGDQYYCIIGPANIHSPKEKFFAGVRKLPATYSASGKYFDSMDSAAKYAFETWGVPIPAKMKPYTSAQLYDIKTKVEHWKKKNEEEEPMRDRALDSKEDKKVSKKDKE